MEEGSLAQDFMAVKEWGWGEGSQQGAEAYRFQSPAGATEAGVLQSMWSQRVGYDSAAKQQQHDPSILLLGLYPEKTII